MKEIKGQRFIGIKGTPTKHALQPVGRDGDQIQPPVAGEFFGEHWLGMVNTSFGVSITPAGDQRQNGHAPNFIGQSGRMHVHVAHGVERADVRTEIFFGDILAGRI